MDRKGFTLIELLIVVVIIGILAAIAIPRFSESRERAFISAMQSDVNQIRQAQEMYFNNSPNLAAGTYTYAANWDGLVAEVAVNLSPGVGAPDAGTGNPTLVGDGTGWSVMVGHQNTDTNCYYFFGDADAVGGLGAGSVGQIRCFVPGEAPPED